MLDKESLSKTTFGQDSRFKFLAAYSAHSKNGITSIGSMNSAS